MDTSETNNFSLNTHASRLFIIGFMGSGKTHWGNIWSARHHYTFLDLDDLIEEQEQHSVTEIFEIKGEDYFRQKEAIMLRSTEQYNNVIVSCGGGTPCFFDNLNWMKTRGSIIFLQAAPATLLKNILTQENKRPLVKKLNEAELLFFIEQKLKERNDFYKQAGLILDAEDVHESSLDLFLETTH